MAGGGWKGYRRGGAKSKTAGGLYVEGQWHCNCVPKRPANHLQTKKAGPNFGRWFYTCSQSPSSRCSFFLWADDARLRETPARMSPPPATKPAPPQTPQKQQRKTEFKYGHPTPATGFDGIYDISGGKERQLDFGVFGDKDVTPSKGQRTPNVAGSDGENEDSHKSKRRRRDSFDWSDDEGHSGFAAAMEELIKHENELNTATRTSTTISSTITPQQQQQQQQQQKDREKSPLSPTIKAVIDADNAPLPLPTKRKLFTMMNEAPTPPPTSSMSMPETSPLTRKTTSILPSSTPTSTTTTTKTPPLSTQILSILSETLTTITPQQTTSITNILQEAERTIKALTRGRDVTRLALQNKEKTIAELGERVAALEAERETLKSVIKTLKGDILVEKEKRARPGWRGGRGGGGGGGGSGGGSPS